MKRWLVLSIPSIVAVSLLAAVIVIEAQQTPDWQEPLNRYIGAADVIMPPVAKTVKANAPWGFGANWGFNIIDYGRYEYGVYTHDTIDYGWRTEHIALPYPPQEVYCVLLREGNVERVIFVNYHTDHLWQYGWVIHEGERRPFTPEFSQRLAAVGCAL